MLTFTVEAFCLITNVQQVKKLLHTYYLQAGKEELLDLFITCINLLPVLQSCYDPYTDLFKVASNI